MKIKTITGSEIDTDKMCDIESQLIELVEQSKIREFIKNNNGSCFLQVKLPSMKNSWMNFSFTNKEDMDITINSLDALFRMMTENKFGLAIVKLIEE